MYMNSSQIKKKKIQVCTGLDRLIKKTNAQINSDVMNLPQITSRYFFSSVTPFLLYVTLCHNFGLRLPYNYITLID